VEAVTTVVPERQPIEGAPAAHVEDTPDTPTIETLVAVARQLYPDAGYTAADTLKNVVVTLVHPDGTREPVVIGLPGDREVDLKRLEAQVSPAEVAPFDDFAKHPLLVKGYLGPQILGAGSKTGIRYLVDPRIVEGTRWVTGANEPGKHVFDLVAGRDFTWDGVVEAAEVRAGDPAPDASGPLELARGVEIGHIFQLGRKYAEALDLRVLDENGKLVTVTMGSYGIGVSRAVAAIAESTHDELGLCWPREVAPADVHVVATGKDAAVFEFADRLAGELVDAGLTVLYDDRPKVSPGVKFKDAELLGMPTIVTVGRGLAEGVVELRDRASGERTEVPVAEATGRVLATVRG
jgi:prolyl-tRNA synthetase